MTKKLKRSLFAAAILCIGSVSAQSFLSTHNFTLPADSLDGFDAQQHISEISSREPNAYPQLINSYLQKKINEFLENKYPGYFRNYNQSSTPQMMVPCTNEDFEMCNYTGWTGGQGNTQVCGAANAPHPVYTQTSTVVGAPQHTIMTGNGLDPCGQFPVVNPGGTCSARLGDGAVSGYGAARLEQTFTVANNNAIFTYYYAVVVQDALHANNEQPFFRADMFDQAGNPILCGNYVVVGGPNIPNFTLSTTCGFNDVYVRPWTPVSIDLQAYIGQNVTIRFTVGDCCYGGHYGYAYVDARCSPLTLVQNDSLCQGGSVTLSAPAGANSYLWTPGNQTTQSITVTTGGQYCCTMTSVANCTTQICRTVVVYPAPVASFTVNNPVCSMNTQFTNTSTGGNTYTWNFGDNTPIDYNQNPTHSYVNTGNYTVTLIVTSSNGCVDSVQVPVSPSNGGTAQFTSTAVCLNNPTVFTDQSTQATQWDWNFDEPSSGPNNVSNLQNPTHTYSTAGTYNVMLVINSSSPCPDTIYNQVTVHPLPTAQFSATTVCEGQVTTFTDQSTISGGNIVSWAWNFGDPNSGPNNISTVQNPTHTFTAAGTYSVILTVTSNQGCQSTFALQVVVYPQPTAQFTATTVCVNAPTVFTDLSTNAVQWAWDFGDNTTGNTQNPTHPYATDGTYTVTLVVTGQGGCTATTTLQVIVNPGPTAQFIATTVCVGNPTVFTDQSTISSGNITSWAWDFGNTQTSGQQSPSYTYLAAGNYTVTLVVTSNNGCSQTITQQVNVNPLPTAAFTNTSVCLNASTQFTDQSTVNPGNITGWAWDFGDNTNSTSQSPPHTYTAPGTYNVILVVTSAGGCIDSIMQTVTVNPLPTPNFTADDTAGCVTHCVNFTDLSTVTPGTITGWAWDFGDGSTSTQQNPNYCYTNAGTYTVTLTVTTNNGCTATLVKNGYITVFPLPVAEFSSSPNPTTVLDPNVNFTDLSQGNPVEWTWTYGDGSQGYDTIQNPSHLFPADNTGINQYLVTLSIVDGNGCVDTVQHIVEIIPEFTFFAPNTVTPNDDGINDFFFTYGIGWKTYKLMIFDRWGDLIWWTEDMNKGWDAKMLSRGDGKTLVQEDTYVWKVVILDVFDKKHNYIGHVSVVR